MSTIINFHGAKMDDVFTEERIAEYTLAFKKFFIDEKLINNFFAINERLIIFLEDEKISPEVKSMILTQALNALINSFYTYANATMGADLSVPPDFGTIN